ncbi:hypothetical protein JX265_013204 [Neoarthrinium moseri]|uniref:N-acetyltransferase domain-containing protein n=1 Tax=Neoarthrinium moseri TaxID=1658444 RepID=A0A9P9W902_9PEZI|nr:uncharacterized protein JN550_013423 [Neoarthrinium moseri]KAI1841103.1 hypothetical protein JX266_012696 [Neoarthrinium moseri]KAI1851457.1 hypothetical protein JX265_013204 [Neoarthrinium moseri]KAI1857186.1 hypothetical protein JN550_013423 [Neoarthrinium moseri]
MTGISLRYRVATPEDIGLLLPLINSAYRGEESRAGWTTEADLLISERIDASGLLDKIQSPDTVILLAADGNDVLASCCELVWRPEKGIAYFGLFAVNPKRQGGGIGRQVLLYAEDYASRQWGAYKMEMTVIWLREEIIAWYARRGYRKTGETRPFPYADIGNGKALRGDLYFEVLVKDIQERN